MYAMGSLRIRLMICPWPRQEAPVRQKGREYKCAEGERHDTIKALLESQFGEPGILILKGGKHVNRGAHPMDQRQVQQICQRQAHPGLFQRRVRDQRPCTASTATQMSKYSANLLVSIYGSCELS